MWIKGRLLYTDIVLKSLIFKHILTVTREKLSKHCVFDLYSTVLSTDFMKVFHRSVDKRGDLRDNLVGK